jgi:hypothetical protein
MANPGLTYNSAMYRGREKQQKSKRDMAASLLQEGHRLARELREEEDREAVLASEYGPKVK